MKKSTLVFCGVGIVIVWAWIGTFISDLSKEVNIAEALEASGALFTALAFAAAGYAVWLQRSSIEMQRQELELQRQELKDTREELKGQKEQLELQNDTLKTQSFERTFFVLVESLSRFVEGMRHGSSSGVDALGGMLSMFNNSYNDAIRSQRCDFENMKKLYEVCVHNSHELFKYVKLLNVLLLRVDENKWITEREKQDYMEIIKAQLSNPELHFLLFHLALSGDNRVMVRVVERYSVFETLDSSSYHEVVRSCYEPCAFRKV